MTSGLIVEGRKVGQSSHRFLMSLARRSSTESGLLSAPLFLNLELILIMSAPGSSSQDRPREVQARAGNGAPPRMLSVLPSSGMYMRLPLLI